MITAEIVNCSTMLVPPDGGREPNNWTTGTTCHIPIASPWEFGWEGLVAIFTILALVAAGSAWWEARRANLIATTAMEQSVEDLKVQIEADRSAIMNQLQLEQLAKYCETLLWYVNHALDISPEQEAELKSNDRTRIDNARQAATINLEERQRELTTRWMTWSMYLLATDPELRIATSNHMDSAIDWADGLLDEKLSIVEGSSSNSTVFVATLRDFVHKANLDAYHDKTGAMLANIQCVMVRGEGWENLRKYIIREYPDDEE